MADEPERTAAEPSGRGAPATGDPAAGRPGWEEGRDHGVARYSERVWPAPWLWLVVLMFTASLGLAYGAALGRTIGLGVGAATTVLAAISLVRGAPILRVDEMVFRAGRARLPLMHVGRVAVLNAENARKARGTRADASGYFVLRTLATSLAVLVEVEDPEDPHRTWLVSTRNPEALARALAEGRDGSVRPGTG